MYHTTSCCLVNGKATQTFLEKHLSSIINVIEERLLENGVSLDDINCFMRDILTKRDSNNEEIVTLDVTKRDSKNEEIVMLEVDDEIQFNYSESNAKGNPCQNNAEIFIENKNTEQSSPLIDIVLSLQTSIHDLENTVVNHIHEMHDCFGQMRDEICSIISKCK